MKFVSIHVAILVCLGSVSRAQEVGDVTFWSGASSLGLSLEGGYQMTPELRARAGWMGGINVDETQTDDGNTYDVDARIGAMTMMLDYSPADTNWRVSGGVLFGRTSIETTISGTPESPINYNGRSFESGSAKSVVEFERSVAPVLTAGYDYPYSDNWVLSGELGAVFIGGFDATFSGDSDALQTAIDNDPDVQSARDDAADASIYPYVSVSVGYKF